VTEHYSKVIRKAAAQAKISHEFVVMQVLPTDYGGQAELIPLQVYVKDHLPKTQVISADVCLLKSLSATHQHVLCQCCMSAHYDVHCAGEPQGMKTFMQSFNSCWRFTFTCQLPSQQTLMFFGGGEHQGFAAELMAFSETFRAFASSLELLSARAQSQSKGSKANRLLQMQKHAAIST